MYINLPDQMIIRFLGGIFIILILIVVGSSLFVGFKIMSKQFAFTRLTLALALAPLCLVSFLDPSSTTCLYLCSTALILLGIAIDGINYLQLSREQPKLTQDAEKKDAESDPDAVVWEKTE